MQKYIHLDGQFELGRVTERLHWMHLVSLVVSVSIEFRRPCLLTKIRYKRRRRSLAKAEGCHRHLPGGTRAPATNQINQSWSH